MVIPLALVKITKCREPKSWYKHRIGQCYLVSKERNEPDSPANGDYWQVVEQTFDNTWKYTYQLISKNECKVILQAV